ncbi:AAA family ATPase [Bacteroides caecicola]|uniref:AAA family ATPase n=1 Tax=Bacteroides caecicola TaxID=1462569 RepID=A0ABS2FAE8_9BACE|nr:AAA family ATPase [Bacteroides caecicola]MBM6806670.1 AAA family ATPase [Bacteroides caecicola]
MRDITIKNFRCYEEKSIEFRRGVNLLIGDNSVGKTSLLRACNLVMNAFFSGFSDENTVWKSADDNDFRSTGITEQPVEIVFHPGEWDFPVISTTMGESYSLDRNIDLKIEKKSKKNSRNLVSGLIPLRDYASNTKLWSHIVLEDKSIQQINPLPVYAYFTTEDIHSVRKFDKEKFKKYIQKPSFGYYECFDCRGLFECWIKRLLVLKEAQKGEDEINFVRNAIIDALGPAGCNIINDMDIRHNESKVYFKFVDGRESESALLSDGYRRLVNIVMDIAFRCALLNKSMFGDQCYKHTHGTVIIDEIDEHLHPALQVRVLKALQDTFPKIQFIVSTHAPLVMSSVEPRKDENGNDINVVYKLEYIDGEYTHKELNIYGMDASTIIETYMGQPSRDLKVNNDIKSILELIDKGDIQTARKSLEELEKNIASGDPELTRMEALISFME